MTILSSFSLSKLFDVNDESDDLRFSGFFLFVRTMLIFEPSRILCRTVYVDYRLTNDLDFASIIVDMMSKFWLSSLLNIIIELLCTSELTSTSSISD